MYVSSGRSNSGNLPLPTGRMVGRETALAEVCHLVATSRLVTLTGPGGIGKSRLALEVASAAQGAFAGGAWWVALGPLCDAGLVAHYVAHAMGLPEDPALDQPAALRRYLEPRHLLLVLDNCEHLVQACAELAGGLLSACPGLHVLATSREPLAVGGESTWDVPALSLPCADEAFTPESVSQSEAGQLFIERAQAIRPEFLLDRLASVEVGRICCRLDGLPLAIELAAVRLRVLSVSQIAERLDERFRLLIGGSRTALPHQHTLKATVDWSYELLTGPERVLFARLSVFRGGFSLEAAEAVAGEAAPDLGSEIGLGEEADALNLLSRLVDKSLVGTTHSGEVRYEMLETIREYAWARLAESGEQVPVRDRHLRYLLALAQRAERRLGGPDQVETLRMLQREHDNMRAALAWSYESRAHELGLPLATALSAFWMRVGHLSEGGSWLERMLAACREVGPLRMWGLYQAGRLAQHRGEYEQAQVLARQSLALSRHLGDLRGKARALGLLGWLAHWTGDRDQAGVLLEEALLLARDGGDVRTVARTLLFLGDLSWRRGAYAKASALLEEGLALYQGKGDVWSMAWAHAGLGDVARLEGDLKRAAAHLRLSLALYTELDSRPEIPYPLEALGLVSAEQGRFEQAARLWGAASAMRDSIHAALPPSYAADQAPHLEHARAALGEQAFARAWAEGERLPAAVLQGIIEPSQPQGPEMPVAAEKAGPPAPSLPPSATYGLTPRELDVLRLVASGLTDAQVAGRLVISPRTVGKHLQSIYSKLYLPSRSAATRWAIEHGLA